MTNFDDGKLASPSAGWEWPGLTKVPSSDFFFWLEYCDPPRLHQYQLAGGVGRGGLSEGRPHACRPNEGPLATAAPSELVTQSSFAIISCFVSGVKLSMSRPSAAKIGFTCAGTSCAFRFGAIDSSDVGSTSQSRRPNMGQRAIKTYRVCQS